MRRASSVVGAPSGWIAADSIADPDRFGRDLTEDFFRIVVWALVMVVKAHSVASQSEIGCATSPDA
jgi:hypothetical protein